MRALEKLVGKLNNSLDNFIELYKEANKPPMEKFPFPEGTTVLVRSVTMYNVGRLVDVTPEFLVLDDSSWIETCSRWEQTLEKGFGDEAELQYQGVILVAKSAVVDIVEYNHPLKKTKK